MNLLDLTKYIFTTELPLEFKARLSHIAQSVERGHFERIQEVAKELNTLYVSKKTILDKKTHEHFLKELEKIQNMSTREKFKIMNT